MLSIEQILVHQERSLENVCFCGDSLQKSAENVKKSTHSGPVPGQPGFVLLFQDSAEQGR
jgi:hypothetical protein